MGAALVFEDFSSLSSNESTEIDPDNEALEEERLKAFETGYGAGWDDALRAQTQAGMVLDEALQSSLSDMSFTREEALQAFVTASQALMESIVNKILPAVAAQTMTQHIASLLQDAITETTDLPIQIRVAPEQMAPVSAAIGDSLPTNVSIAPDSSLSPIQAVMSLGDTESQIDLDGLISEISKAISELSTTTQEGT